MPYKVEIAETEYNKEFLKNLPKEIYPKPEKYLKNPGEHPHLGRSIERVISAYIYTFQVDHDNQNYHFIVSYKINEGSETLFITDFGLMKYNN